MADTLSTQIAESTQEIIEATITLIDQFAPMPNLVTRREIPSGRNALEIPRVNSTPTIETPTEGDDLVNSSQFDLTSTTISPTLRAVKVRIGRRAVRFSQDDVIGLISEWLAQAEAQDMDTDLTAEFTNWHTDNDVGTTNTDLTLAVLRQARRLLYAVTLANGGPAPDPIYTVLAPIPEEDLYTDIGLQGVVASTAPWIPRGLSEDLMRRYAIPDNRLAGVTMFRDGYMTEDGSSDFICSMFSQRALYLAISEDWDMETFKESNFIGTILRAVADYESGIGGYTHWGSQITADGA